MSTGRAGCDDVQIAASENHIGATGGHATVVSAEVSRPANTTAYTALDAVAGLLTFTNVARVAGGSGYLTAVQLFTNQAANVARFRLYLFSVDPSPLAADNDPFAALWSRRASQLGFTDFAAMASEGTGSDVARAQNIDIVLPFVCAAGNQSLYGLLMTLDAFTPASGQTFTVKLWAELN